MAVKPRRPADDPFGHRLGVDGRVTYTVETDPIQTACVAGLIADRVDASGAWPFKLPFIHKGKIIVDDDGAIQKGEAFWFEWMPADLQKVIGDASAFMWSEILRFVSLIVGSKTSHYSLHQNQNCVSTGA